MGKKYKPDPRNEVVATTCTHPGYRRVTYDDGGDTVTECACGYEVSRVRGTSIQ